MKELAERRLVSHKHLITVRSGEYSQCRVSIRTTNFDIILPVQNKFHQKFASAPYRKSLKSLSINFENILSGT